MDSNKLVFHAIYTKEYNRDNHVVTAIIDVSHVITTYVSVIFGFLFTLLGNFVHSYLTVDSHLFGLSLVVSIITSGVYTFFGVKLIMAMHIALKEGEIDEESEYVPLKSMK